MKHDFKIGDWVWVTEYIGKFDYNREGQRYPRKSKGEFAAQIVGSTIRFLGKRDGGTPRIYNEYYDPSYLKIEGSMQVWLVRRGMTNKELMVDEDSIKRTDVAPHAAVPWRYANVKPWTEQQKEWYREAVKNAPRDKKGRWVKA